METAKLKKSGGAFQTMGLSAKVLKGILHKGYKVPTPIQRRAIPIALAGRDLVAMARTGSGKTAAFLVPIIEKLASHSQTVGVRAIILSPTRELAIQTLVFAKAIAKHTDLRFAVIVGGDSMEEQYTALAANPDVLIATPGRLMHHLIETGMSLKLVQFLVFDEADRLFEMGFADQISTIMTRIPPEQRQTLLFSATMPSMLMDFTRAGLKNPAIVRLDTDTKISDDLKLEFVTCRHEFKLAVLLYLLREVVNPDDSTIIFVATRHHVEFISETLKAFGHDVSMAYGTMEQSSRIYHVNRFRAGETKLLVVTDVAARGIDIPMLNNVINYDFPARAKLFVHRAGRAARAGRSGTAYSIVSPDEVAFMVDLHLFLGRKLACKLVPDAGPTTISYYGNVPQTVLDELQESLKIIGNRTDNFENLSKAMQNSYKLYYKTRPQPTKDGARYARTLKKDVVNPVLAERAGIGQIMNADFLQRIKSFKPKTTTFELDPLSKQASIMQVKRAKDQHVVSDHADVAVIDCFDPHNASLDGRHRLGNFDKKMRDSNSEDASDDDGSDDDDGVDEDEEIDGNGESNDEQDESDQQGSASEDETASGSNDDEVAEEEKEELQEPPKKKAKKDWRESQYFMPYTASSVTAEQALAVRERRSNDDGEARIEDMVMDMSAEDRDAMIKKRAVYVWDKKKKNYVKLYQGTEAAVQKISGKKRQRNESGTIVKGKIINQKESSYEQWKKQSHLRIQSVGEREGEEVEGAVSMMKQRGPKRRGIWHTKNNSDQHSGESQEHSRRGANRSELKNPEQIRKERKDKKKRQFVEKKRAQANHVRKEKFGQRPRK